MNTRRITILRDSLNTNLKTGIQSDNSCLITTGGFKEWIRQGIIWRHLWRYKEANIITYHLDILPRPLMAALLLRLLSWNHCWLEDEQGNCKEVTFSLIIQLLGRFINDYSKKNEFLRHLNSHIDHLRQLNNEKKTDSKSIDLNRRPVYLRTDLVFGLCSGGSIGHIAGVLNNLDSFCGQPIFLTTDHIPTVRSDIEIHRLFPRTDDFWSLQELPLFACSKSFFEVSEHHLDSEKLCFIYQRYSLNNYCGVKLAVKLKVPFILEYNGSEIWINRNWGTPLKYEALSEKVELLNLEIATLVVVVSRPIYDELVARGIEPEKILINPNGVDPDRYSPGIDGSEVRQRYQLNSKTVIGFIGTFGKWHGAEVLAEAYGQLLQDFPDYRDRVWLLMIGDGVTMPQVKQNLEKYAVMDTCTLTGIVPQEQGPTYLAACDILASPHVPNPDGTPFFGSPTKLFEYMAMGKGIVASNLDQIGEVLQHDHTAWMVQPGNAESLKLGLKVLIDDEQRRQRLGWAARQEVVAKYTWKEHTRKIIEKLKERCG